jgi:hypothetical protein
MWWQGWQGSARRGMSGKFSEWLGVARLGAARLALRVPAGSGISGTGSARRGWLGTIWPVEACPGRERMGKAGLARLCFSWCVPDGYGVARRGRAKLVGYSATRYVLARCIWSQQGRQGQSPLGEAKTRQGWPGLEVRIRPGLVFSWPGSARSGRAGSVRMAGLNRVGPDGARQGKAGGAK